MVAKKNPANTEIHKTENINVRCTPDQKALIDSAAKHKGLPASTWMLSLILEAARDVQANR